MLKTFVMAGVLSAGICRIMISMAARWRLTGKPALRQGRGRDGVSPLGSIGLVAACMIMLAWGARDLNLLGDAGWHGWLVGSVWLVALGLVDDLWWELPPLVKGIGQVIVAVMLLTSGMSVKIMFLPPWMNSALTILWVVAMTNAFNLLDILDGLASTVALIAAIAFAVLAAWAGQGALTQLAFIMAGALGGFLLFNRPPARLYMGDAGSQWLGYTLATLALAIQYAPLGREAALCTPVIVLGLPTYDLAYVTWLRLRQGRSPFQKSSDHFALRLVKEGASPGTAVLAMAGLAAGFACVGLYVARAHNLGGVLAVIVVMAAAIGWGWRLAVVETHG